MRTALGATVLRGSLLALGTGAACAILAFGILGRTWYLSILLPLASTLLLLVAWLSHLRDERLMRLQENRADPRPGGAAKSRMTLAMAAVELAVAAALLHGCLGVGARFG